MEEEEEEGEAEQLCRRNIAGCLSTKLIEVLCSPGSLVYLYH